MTDFAAGLSWFWIFVIGGACGLLAAGLLALLGRLYNLIVRTYFDAF